jgi:hypothetical protein
LNLVKREETTTNTIVTTNHHAAVTETEGWEEGGAGESAQTFTFSFFFYSTINQLLNAKGAWGNVPNYSLLYDSVVFG